MNAFAFKALPWNLEFGAGSRRRLPAILAGLGLRRPLFLATAGRRDTVAALAALLPGPAAIFAQAAPHVPAEVVEAARAAARDAGADCTVSVGGGSTTGLGKALRLHAELPQVAVPTTYAGSEMTDIWGITEDRVKRTGRALGALPVAVLYDPELLLDLPPEIAGPSVMNAMAQAIANLPACNDDPIPALFARAAFERLARHLPRLLADGADIEVCAELLCGACLAGAALGTGRTGLHHRICHVLGGMYNLPHAETHAVLLPYSTAFNAKSAPRAAEIVATALAAADAGGGLHALMQRCCRRTSLRALGLDAAQLDAATDAVIATPVANPAPVTRAGVRQLLQQAWTGAVPSRGG